MKASTLLVSAVSIAAGVVVGWSLHVPPSVHAAYAGPAEFQLQGTGPATQLGIYFPDDKDLYVYPGIAAGGSSVNCAFKLHIARAGDPIERTNCGIGKRN
jgi:hypothetical protein